VLVERPKLTLLDDSLEMPSPTSDLAAHFIAKLWSLQPHEPREPFGILAVKDWDTGDWSNHPVAAYSPNPPNTANLEGADDLYFTPCLFDQPRARKEFAAPSRILYADLDEVDPVALDLCPTLAWETSPDHFQAVWILDRPLTRQSFERLNQRLTYATGADKGGWSSTKVLRVPGSVSTKYAEPFRVRIVQLPKPRRYTVEQMRGLLRDIPTTLDAPGTLPPSTTLPDADETYASRRKQIPVRARQLLSTKSIVAGDDRSARLWELESLLIDAGLEAEEVYVLVRRSVWNKYMGQRREATQLWGEIAKAKANAAGAPSSSKPPTKTKHRRREIVMVDDFRWRAYETPTWLVNQMWTRGAFGFLAGESKAYKSLLALDMAVSVSSGTSFLSYFQIPIASCGPVLLWQEENDEGLVQERLRRIEYERQLLLPRRGFKADLSGRSYHLGFGNRQSIDLADEKDLKYIHRQIHKHQPVLVILDPLYMMTPTLDENEATAITPMLANLKKIQDDTNTSICVVHHYKKPQQGNKSRAMHRMSGTGVFGRRYDSAIWVEVVEESSNMPIIRISTSHRAQASGGSYIVSFEMPDDDEMSYTTTVRPCTDDENN
jgi:AAA domain/RepB DNA-primase from phage plasmid